MRDWHHELDLPEPLVAEGSDDELRVGLPEGPHANFVLVSVPSLTRRTVADALERAERSSQRIFVSYRQSSAEARAALRAAGISFAGEDGRLFVRAPGILVSYDERPQPRSAKRWDFPPDELGSARNPFAKRSSRIPRWLLLHHDESFSVAQLADAVDLNRAAASRVVRTLEDAAFVRELAPLAGGRRRHIRLERPRRLLDAWLPLWERRRIRQQHWDIGAREVDEALTLLRDAVGDRPGRWAIGGLAGAATVRRAVEPADVLIWTSTDQLAALTDALQPEPARGGRGLVRIALAPDAWTLGLARPVDGLPVADHVQLWLDCASEGERSLEAADAIAQAAGWS